MHLEIGAAGEADAHGAGDRVELLIEIAGGVERPRRDEYTIAGALRGEPVSWYRDTIDINVPATAE